MLVLALDKYLYLKCTGNIKLVVMNVMLPPMSMVLIEMGSAVTAAARSTEKTLRCCLSFLSY